MAKSIVSVGSRGRGGMGDRFGGRGRGGFPGRFPDSLRSSDRCDLTVDPHLLYPEEETFPPSIPEECPSLPLFSGPGETSFSNPTLGDKQHPDIPLSSSPKTASFPLPYPPSLPLKRSASPQALSENIIPDSELPPTLLLTSVSPPSQLLATSSPSMKSETSPFDSAAHSVLVSNVVRALSSSQGSFPSNVAEDSSCMEEEVLSVSSEDLDVDMIADPLHRNSKMEAIARRDTGKAGSSRKKGRKSLPT